MTPRADARLHICHALLPDGWADDVRVTIADGRFVTVERGVAADGDASIGVALPGMPNVHSHAFQRGMAGLTEYRGPAADNFWSWRTLMYQFVARMTPDDLEAVSAQAFVDMLEGGFTRVGEFHYVHHDADGTPYANPAELTARIVAAAAHTGIALTLLPVFYAHGGFGGAPANAGQRRFLLDVPGYARLLDSARRETRQLPHALVGVAPHSLRAVTPAELGDVVSLANGGPIHIHAAEQTGEVDQCLAWSGARPIEWLLGHAPVDARWTMIHATHMTDDEVTRLARVRTVAGLCPVTEANLGDGISQASAFLAARGAFGIGTDSNVRISVAEELRQLEYSQRLRDRARNVVQSETPSTGRTLFDGALAGGSQSLGAMTLGAVGIAPGAPADFFSLDPDSTPLVARRGDALLDSFVFAGGNECIDGVWRAGAPMVVGGRHVRREEIASAYRAALGRLTA